MADGYARATGRTGVCLTSTGPGAANAAGAMLEALTASSPVLHLTGQVELPYLDRNRGFLHEAKDQLAMLRAVTGYAERVTTTEGIPEAVASAFRATRDGRPQPAALEIPIDLQYADADFALPDASEPEPVAPSADEVRALIEALRDAHRPVIWAGGGVVSAGASDELTLLAERLGAPVVTTTTGRGSIPEDHRLALGNLFNDQQIKDLLASSDCLLAVGTRFQGAHTQNWTLKLPDNLIHIDIDRTNIGRNYPARLAVVADARAALSAVLDAFEGAAADADYTAEVSRVRGETRAKARSQVAVHLPFMDGLRETLDRDAIVVKDATIPAYTWGNRLLEVYEPRTSLHSASVAIGPGLALALGAKLGRPDRQTVLIAGDGGFMLNIAELATAAQYNIGVVILLFNDRGYGVLRNHQDQRFEGRRIGVDLHTPDFVKLAEGFGVKAERVESSAAFRPALEHALEAGGPVLLDIDQLKVGVVQFPSAAQPSMSTTARR
jgi:acetolactate synthase-1/2/3 large subunit